MDGLDDDEAAFRISQAYTTRGGHPSVTPEFAYRLYAKVLTCMRAACRAAYLAD